MCRFQRGLDWQWLFNQAVGERITVSGFLRCSFAEAGFKHDYDAHIFEIHPVHAFSIRGELHSIEAAIPESDRIQMWTSELSSRDAQIGVQYWKGSDILVFRIVEGEDASYVQLARARGSSSRSHLDWESQSRGEAYVVHACHQAEDSGSLEHARLGSYAN